MLRLDLLGAVDIVDAGGRSLRRKVGGDKPLAVLIYLVLEGHGRPVRRDRIAGLLWPDSEQEKARGSLSQTVHQIRKALGDVVTSDGHENLTVDGNQITCDCFEFERLADAGRLEAAVNVYRGDIAPGFNVKDAAEFDVWLSREREVWRKHYAEVLRKAVDVSVQANQLAMASGYAEKLLESAPENDGPIGELIKILITRQPAAAIRLYDIYKRKLHDEFGTMPPAELTALMDTLPESKLSAIVARRSPFRVGDPVRGIRNAPARMVGATAALAIAGILVVQLAGFLPSNVKGTGAALATSPPKVAVVPFAYAGSSQRSASVLNEALQWRLRSVGFDVLKGSSDTSAVRKLIGTEGQTGVTFVVGGEVVTEAEAASIVARLWLIDAASGKRIWHSRFEQKQSNAHLIATDLSEAVATEVRKAAGDAFELASSDVSAQSWREVYRARERMEAASDMRREGSSAGSATELKDAEMTLAAVGAREDDWALPWVLRARIAEGRATNALITGDARRGGAELDRGIRTLDSVAARLNSPEIYEMRGLLQFRRFLFGVDDVDDANRLLRRAEADLQKALGSGEERSGSYSALSGVMFAQGKYAEALVYSNRAYESNVFLRSNEEVLNRLFNSALHAGNDAKADEWCREIQKTQPGKWQSVMCRIHVAGFAPQFVDARTLESEIANFTASPPVRRAFEPKLKAAYAVTLAQLGRADSARAVLASVAGSEDPDVIQFRAFAFAALKDAPQTHAQLRKYLAEHRGTRSLALHMRWLH